MKIILNKVEKRLQQVFLNVVASIPSPTVTLRIAGGWVRDKLLGLESNDIDIAIDSMTGELFAIKVKEFMQAQQFPMSQVSKIQINPDKSKHLETATARLFGLDVDFVNLRSETYNNDSRNPVIDFGTPLQDAERRDITINALFYNLHTNQVEDFTGNGINDLENRVIQTPLPPLQTFLDDPLRILRVIRFASRFDFFIHPDIRIAVKDPVLHAAFAKKISRERIGVEIEKMLKGPNPLLSLELIYEFGFYNQVFAIPPEQEAYNVDIKHAIIPPEQEAYNVDIKHAMIALRILNRWVKDSSSNSKVLRQSLPLDEDHIGLLFLAVALAPFRHHVFELKNKEVPAIRYMVLFSLKLSVNQAEFCDKVMRNIGIVQEMTRRNSHSLVDRKDLGWILYLTLGLFVRKISERPISQNWDLTILISLVMELAVETGDSNQVISRHEALMKSIIGHSLENVHLEKSILDGKQVAKIMGIKPGPKIGSILEKLMAWQLGLVDPTREGAIAFLKGLK